MDSEKGHVQCTFIVSKSGLGFFRDSGKNFFPVKTGKKTAKIFNAFRPCRLINNKQYIAIPSDSMINHFLLNYSTKKYLSNYSTFSEGGKNPFFPGRFFSRKKEWNMWEKTTSGKNLPTLLTAYKTEYQFFSILYSQVCSWVYCVSLQK